MSALGAAPASARASSRNAVGPVATRVVASARPSRSRVARATPRASAADGIPSKGTRASRRSQRRLERNGGAVGGASGDAAGASSAPSSSPASPAGDDVDAGALADPAAVAIASPPGDDVDTDATRDRSPSPPVPPRAPARAAAPSTRPVLPVDTCQHVHLGSGGGGPDALRRLRRGLRDLVRDAADGSLPPFRSGVVRLTVAVPRTVDALEWLAELPADDALLPSYYVSPRSPPPAVRSGDGDDGGDDDTIATSRGARGVGPPYGSSESPHIERGDRDRHAEPPEWRSDPRGATAAAGSARIWTGDGAFGAAQLAAMRRFLGTGEPHDSAPRAYGAGRFDPETTASDEWRCFGGHYFFLPLLEVAEGAKCATVACVVAWDGDDADVTVESAFAATRETNRGANDGVLGANDGDLGANDGDLGANGRPRRERRRPRRRRVGFRRGGGGGGDGGGRGVASARAPSRLGRRRRRIVAR